MVLLYDLNMEFLQNFKERKYTMQYTFLTQIAFPGFGIKPFSINPVAFTLFGKDVYWYGIIIATGLILAYVWAYHDCKKLGINTELLTDLLLVGVPAAIVCARLYYVAFSWDSYKSNPIDIIKIWEGGIAIYGGIIGAFAAGLIYAKIKKIPFYKIADLASPCFLIGQAVGRWGNFINVEAYGKRTTLPWRMEIVQKAMEVHPTFLYESLWNGVGFIILALLRKKKPFEGFVFYAYLFWYGLGRVWIEELRTDSLMLGNLRVSQILAAVCIVVSLVMIILKWKDDKVKI